MKTQIQVYEGLKLRVYALAEELKRFGFDPPDPRRGRRAAP